MNLIDRDLKHLWHPCSQMKDYEEFKPLPIDSAKGSYLNLTNGEMLIDAISSWWCKSLGHGHERIKSAVIRQMDKFEHVILANTTNETIVELSERLAQMTKTLNKVFYASDGSSALEIAIKMALHAQNLKGNPKKTKFLAFENAYHGETIMTLALGDLGIYKKDYEALFPETAFIQNIPYVHSKNDEKWKNAEEEWEKAEKWLNTQLDSLAGIVFEPILQGAGGMKIYSPDFLKRLKKWAEKNDVYLIADEIMTGFGRTGKALAIEYAEIEPDFICVSKGLTSGWLPLSAVMTSTKTYDLFYDDYENKKSFLHSHTYTGNALAAAAAVEVFKIFEDEKIYEKIPTLEENMFNFMHEVSEKTGKLKNIRGIGGLVAADLDVSGNKRYGYEIFKVAVKKGALLRPLGNTIYWLPPLNTDFETLEKLKNITVDSIKIILK